MLPTNRQSMMALRATLTPGRDFFARHHCMAKASCFLGWFPVCSIAGPSFYLQIVAQPQKGIQTALRAPSTDDHQPTKRGYSVDNLATRLADVLNDISIWLRLQFVPTRLVQCP